VVKKGSQLVDSRAGMGSGEKAVLAAEGGIKRWNRCYDRGRLRTEGTHYVDRADRPRNGIGDRCEVREPRSSIDVMSARGKIVRQKSIREKPTRDPGSNPKKKKGSQLAQKRRCPKPVRNYQGPFGKEKRRPVPEEVEP